MPRCSAGRWRARTSRRSCSGSSTCSPRAVAEDVLATSTSTSTDDTPGVVRARPRRRAPVPLGARSRRRRARDIRRMARQFIAGADPQPRLPGRRAAVDRRATRSPSTCSARRRSRAPTPTRYAARVVRCSTRSLGAATGVARGRLLERDPWGPLPRGQRLGEADRAVAAAHALTTADEGIAEALEPAPPGPRPRHAAGRHHPPRHRARRGEGRHVRAAARIGRRVPGRPQLGCVVQAYRNDAFADLRRPGRVVGRHARACRCRSGWSRAPTGTTRRSARAHRLAARRCGPQGRDRRQLRALHAPARRPRRRGPARVRQPQPAQPRPRRCAAARGAGLRRRRRRAAAAVRHGRAGARRGARPRRTATRVYVPVGELVPGMAYLVRRLLENTSNESFVRHRFAEGRELDELIAAPTAALDTDRPAPTRRRRRPTRATRAASSNEPAAELRRAPVRDRLARRRRARRARARLRRARPRRRRGVDDRRRRSRRSTRAHSTRRLPQRVPPTRAIADARGRGRRAVPAPAWRATPWRERAAVLFRAADDPARAGASSSRADGVRGRQAASPRPTPTCARRSTSASTTGARRSASADGGPRRSTSPGEANTLLATSRAASAS